MGLLISRYIESSLKQAAIHRLHDTASGLGAARMRARYSRKDSSSRWGRFWSAFAYSQCTAGTLFFFKGPTSFVESMSAGLLFCLSCRALSPNENTPSLYRTKNGDSLVLFCVISEENDQFCDFDQNAVWWAGCFDGWVSGMKYSRSFILISPDVAVKMNNPFTI